jgi:chromosome segregation ATPase
MLTTPEEGHTRAVDYRELEQLSRQGWVLVAVLEHQGVEQVDEVVPFEAIQVENLKINRPYNNEARPVTWKKPVMVQAQRYLMRKSKDATIADLAEALDKQRESAHTYGALKASAENRLAEAQKALEAKQAEIDRVRTEADKAKEDLHLAMARSRTLESDIAKVRKAVGALKMKEILGSAE